MKKAIFILFIAVTALTEAACTDDMSLTTNPTGVTGDTVGMSLNIKVADMTPSTRAAVETRALGGSVDDPETPTSQMMKGLWVLQFNGTADNSRLIFSTYYEPDNFNIADFSSDSGKQKLKFIDSGAKTNTVLFLSNVGGGIGFPQNVNATNPSTMTLADAKSMYLKSAYGYENSFLYTDEGSTYHIPLYGSYTGAIHPVEGDAKSQSMDVNMNYSLAKVKVNIKNTTAETAKYPLKVYFVSLINVPDVNYYFPEPKDGEEFPDESMVNFDTSSKGSNWSVFCLNSGKDTTATADGLTQAWYMPANMRGTGEIIDRTGGGNVSQKLKALYAPEHATYLCIDGYYEESADKNVDVSYYYYLGSDLTYDFNIKPGHEYQYNITIKSLDPAQNDMRMEKYDDVEFSNTDLANSYILNPKPITNREFSIPIDRINQFWGNSAYGNNSGNTLKVGDKWEAFILWTDFENNNSLTLTKSTGEVTDLNNLGYFTVMATANCRGNALIGVRRTGNNTNILWSWHLWLTDYEPDKASMHTATSGQYVYPVPGGAVHRYEGWGWNDANFYGGKFIMDRNLGARSTGYASDRQGCLYYQYGRKDPFPYRGNIYPGSNASSYFDNSNNIRFVQTGVSSSDNNVVNAVQRPTTFYYTSNDIKMWTGNTSFSRGNNIWFDNQKKRGTYGKSIFDPCPPGYKVPQAWYDDSRDHTYSPWEDFTYRPERDDATRINTSVVNEGFPETDGELYYWPVTSTDASISSQHIIYPMTGYYHVDDGSPILYHYGNIATSWTSRQSGSNGANYLSFGTTSIQNNTKEVRLESIPGYNGMPVRCIKE